MPTLGTDSYATEAEYQAYCDSRGITLNVATIDADLVLSADFIDTYYTFKGDKIDDAQAMKLPTDQVAIADIKKAALKAVELQQDGRLTIDFAAVSGGVIKRERKKADVLEKEVEYQDGTATTFKPRVPELDLLLRPFIGGASFAGKVLL